MIRGFFPFGLKGRMEKMAASIRRGRRRRGSLEGEKTSTLFLPPQTKITRINVKGRGRGENGRLFSLSENRWSFIVCRGIVKTSNLPPPPPVYLPSSFATFPLVIRLEAQFSSRTNDRNSIIVEHWIICWVCMCVSRVKCLEFMVKKKDA